jgi:hypothetical protein
MAWNFNAQGKPEVVAKRADAEILLDCTEPERTIRSNVAGAIAVALAAIPPGFDVELTVSFQEVQSPNRPRSWPLANSLVMRLTPFECLG